MPNFKESDGFSLGGNPFTMNKGSKEINTEGSFRQESTDKMGSYGSPLFAIQARNAMKANLAYHDGTPFNAIAGRDPNWGRIIMAVGKADVDIEINKLSLKLGDIKIIEKGQISKTYIEDDAGVYMREENKIDITIELNLGKKNFTAYTMDLTQKYIEINADYRS